MSCHDGSTPGSAGAPLVRPSYFFGQVLGVDEFRDEQTYHVQARRRHDLALHGWGVVTGLDVTAGGGGAVEVSAGVAVDPCGREIVVPEAVPVLLGAYQGSPGSSEDLDIV